MRQRRLLFVRGSHTAIERISGPRANRGGQNYRFEALGVLPPLHEPLYLRADPGHLDPPENRAFMRSAEP